MEQLFFFFFFLRSLGSLLPSSSVKICELMIKTESFGSRDFTNFNDKEM